MTLHVIPITNGAGVEDWLERTKGWSIYPSILSSQLPSLTEGKSSAEEGHILTKINFGKTFRKTRRRLKK